ncbi:uncharacterized protein LOC133465158 isoform X1 [Phyllopteryx taeniolatus]|uniref:uncharacterized protein LOC133465158 isoform X1 n=1 Tax=Phyllopteryx taeniolatus TaxID=161469 RepID=UPI002AD49200|nr:uncharacterized protein LOC133465158 isoform X1 [Phyllopteryx taeniolatus]
MQVSRSNMLDVGVFNKVKYSHLAGDDDGYIELQFKKSPPKVPYKAIALAIFLFLIGSLLITFGALFLSGTIDVEEKPKSFCANTDCYFELFIMKPALNFLAIVPKAPRSHHPCHHYWASCFPSWILPFENRLLRRQGIPRLFL